MSQDDDVHRVSTQPIDDPIKSRETGRIPRSQVSRPGLQINCRVKVDPARPLKEVWPHPMPDATHSADSENRRFLRRAMTLAVAEDGRSETSAFDTSSPEVGRSWSKSPYSFADRACGQWQTGVFGAIRQSCWIHRMNPAPVCVLLSAFHQLEACQSVEALAPYFRAPASRSTPHLSELRHRCVC